MQEASSCRMFTKKEGRMIARNQTILIVEDEDEIREGIRILLSGERYTILEASDGAQALALLSEDVDLIILDVMMPGMSGFRVCEEIRKSSSVPILFLTAKAQESDKLVGLSAGGDDYLTKPFSYVELIARVKALLRRYYIYRGKDQADDTTSGAFLELRGIRIARTHNEVWVRGAEANLTEIEYQILLLLMSNPSRIFSAQSIYESVWNEPFLYMNSGTVMVHIRKLRVKIEEDPQEPKLIQTAWGKGYRFRKDDSIG